MPGPHQIYKNMEYRYLGNSGLKVSVISFGNWLNSNSSEAMEQVCANVKYCFDNGVNFFDTAEIYGSGEAEIQFGEALKRLNVPRNEYVVSTKILYQNAKDKIPNTFMLSRKHVIEGTKNSLKRLGLDYVDIVFAHRYDQNTPIEEVCRAFDYLINNGLAYYWGTSEWEPDQIIEAYAVCDKLNLIRPVVEQPQYNMLVREKFEVGFGNLFDKYRMGSTVWSPLAGGLLSGKYNQTVPEGSRLADPEFKSFYYKLFFDPEVQPKTQALLQKLEEYAKELNCSQAQLALAWVIKNQDVSTAIVGATKQSQLEDNFKAVELYKKLNSENWEKLENILGNRPATKMDYNEWKPNPFRR